MNKKFAVMTIGLFVLFSGEIAVAGVTVTDTVLSKEKPASGQAPQPSAKKTGEKAGNTSTPATAGSKSKK